VKAGVSLFKTLAAALVRGKEKREMKRSIFSGGKKNRVRREGAARKKRKKERKQKGHLICAISLVKEGKKKKRRGVLCSSSPTCQKGEVKKVGPSRSTIQSFEKGEKKGRWASRWRLSAIPRKKKERWHECSFPSPRGGGGEKKEKRPMAIRLWPPTTEGIQ